MQGIDLGRPSVLAKGSMLESYPTEMYDLRSEVNNLLIKKAFIDRVVPLEELHLYLRQEDMAVDGPDGLNNVSTGFYETSPEFRQTYSRLTKYIAERFFDFDLLFQETPTIRFHFPGPFSEGHRATDGLLLNYHTDTLLGHPLEEINCWLPLTWCQGSSALQLAPLEGSITALTLFAGDIGFDADVYHSGRELFFKKMSSEDEFQRFIVEACKPVAMKYGELILFDSRCIHGTAENREAHTRVSLDFRLIPVEAYNELTRLYRSQGRSRRTFARGDIYSAKSAREL